MTSTSLLFPGAAISFTRFKSHVFFDRVSGVDGINFNNSVSLSLNKIYVQHWSLICTIQLPRRELLLSAVFDDPFL